MERRDILAAIEGAVLGYTELMEQNGLQEHEQLETLMCASERAIERVRKLGEVIGETCDENHIDKRAEGLIHYQTASLIQTAGACVALLELLKSPSPGELLVIGHRGGTQ